MSNRSCLVLAAFLAGLFPVASARAQTTDIGGPYGEYDMAYQGAETLTLYVVPDGSGDSFDLAGLPAGGTADGTITLLLTDSGGFPVASFPAEDMWLQSRDNGLIPCMGGTMADSATGPDGKTRWREPLSAGGHSQELTVVIVNGSELEISPGVRLGFNSPDINGDLAVNLADVQIFTEDFYSGGDFRSDFHRDGNVNLSDLGLLASAIGATCP